MDCRQTHARRLPWTMNVYLILALLISIADAGYKDVLTFDTNSGSTIGATVTVMAPTVKPATIEAGDTNMIAPTTKPTRASQETKSQQQATTKPVNKPEVTPSAGCCAKCIGDTSQAVYTYDPLVFEQCQAAKGICCFGCKPEDAFHPILDNCTYPDGITPQVPSGDWIKFQWRQVTRVTYEFYQTRQRKITTVRNSSAEARIEGDWFFICPHAPGKVVLRGWGADSCHLASKEFTINVAQGSSSSTKCTDHLQVEVNVANTKHDGTEQCNLQRATISKVNGVDTCICTSEWRGPPSCSGFSWWKIVITGCGGAAAVLSVVVSVRAFLNSRTSKTDVDNDHHDDVAVVGDYPFGNRDNVFIKSPKSSEKEYDL